MCDYSLESFQSRPAKVGDKLVIRNFGSTRGFASVEDIGKTSSEAAAVCLLPGTEVVFDAPVRRASNNQPNSGQHPAFNNWPSFAEVVQLKSAVAVFCQMDMEQERIHHDALTFAEDHDTVLINHLVEGQQATVLQLPAPKIEAKGEEKAVETELAA